jgi:hypothetical protein
MAELTEDASPLQLGTGRWGVHFALIGRIPVRLRRLERVVRFDDQHRLAVRRHGNYLMTFLRRTGELRRSTRSIAAPRGSTAAGQESST